MSNEEKDIRESFLRYIMRQGHGSQLEIVQKTGLSRPTISRFRSGARLSTQPDPLRHVVNDLRALVDFLADVSIPLETRARQLNRRLIEIKELSEELWIKQNE